jgi:hypothetical protein
VPATVFAHGNSTGAATEPDVTLISPANDTTVSTALMLVSKPAGAGDTGATCVASFTTEYNDLDCAINDITTELLEQDRKLVKRFDELLPLVKRMWMLLSQRGDLHALVSRDSSLASELEQLEDVPTWTQWYEAFSSRIIDAPSLRTIQRKLKKLRGCDEPETTVDVDATEDDTDESSLCGGLHERDEVKSGAELLAEHAKKMLDVLAGKSIMSDAMRITRAVSLVKDLQRALEDGFLVVTTNAPTSKALLLEGEVGSDQVRGAYAKLRSVFNRMADTAEIENVLKEALEEFVQPMIAEHPYMQVDAPYRPELQVSVTLYRPGRSRINAGDWVEYRGGDDRLKKQIGAEAALGHVVEAGPCSRPRITWFNGTKWVNPYALFDEEAVHVLFADQAASAYPEAFSTYSEPAGSKPPTAVPTMEADASASPQPSAVPALAAPVGAQGLEVTREHITGPAEVSTVLIQNLVDDNSTARQTDSAARTLRPPANMVWTQLVPGKKYQTRPAPSGGHGVYEPRSTVILQWYVEEDDARDAIDPVTAIAVGA